MKLRISAVVLLALAASAVQARDQINIVGSSTVYPFATVVAERFGKSTAFKTPKIEATGSGGGLKLFCAGVGISTPDITNSSRKIKSREVETCSKNGVSDVTEAKIGYDGIVLANSKATAPMELTPPRRLPGPGPGSPGPERHRIFCDQSVHHLEGRQPGPARYQD